MNQWYNKENARLQSIKDKQENLRRYTNRQLANLTKHNNRVNDYMNKTAKYILNYCIDNNIGKIVCGYSKTFQYKPNMFKKTKQHFLGIPYGKLREKLEYLCEINNIIFIKQEESYTRKSSFFDNDHIPTYNADNPQNYKFSGKRVKRGLYKTSSNEYFNADCNGALNILKKCNDNCKDKSKTVSMSTLCSSGDLNTPIRIRLI